jgi:poly(3-hydroxybutyrate) depolymerase
MLMRGLVVVAVSFVFAVAAGVTSQQPAAPRPSANGSGPDPVLYTETRTTASTFRDRGTSYAPTYFIYVDKQRTPEQAKQLIEDLGMAAHLEEYKARAFVVGPSSGTAYGPADLTAFQNLLRTRRSSNLKVIGIGAGATFVNSVISKHAFAIAGILTYGGTVDTGVTSSIPVPAYVHGSDRALARLYLAANGASAKIADSAAFTTYTNPGPHQGLQRVVVGKQPDANENLAQAFQNAWKTVFSRNYRLYMSQTESYSQGFDPNDHSEPWELEPYVMYDELGVRYEAVTEELPGIGLSLRYEYVPRQAIGAPPKSVPLVIMLHGNGNDPRIQGESSGWVEVAAKHTILLTSVEWQGRTAQEPAFAAIGEPGTMAILDRLLAKYPQIDPGRVYFTGLSAGAMNSFSYGVNNLRRIAGVAGHSAPFGPPPLLDAAMKAKASGQYLPVYAIAGNRDMYKPLPVNQTPRSFYTVIRAFALLNDIAVPDGPDLAVNEMFGLKLDGPGWSELAGRRAMIGSLSNSKGVMIQLVALDPYGHWNFKPAAEDMWAFLSRFRRDPTTGALSVSSLGSRIPNP